MKGFLRLAVFLALFAPAVTAQGQVQLERVFTEGAIGRPVDLRHDPANRVYVAEQGGRIRAYDAGTYLGEVFDIADRVGEADQEGGLQSFAFHPGYEENGYVFVTYVAGEGATRRTVLARFERGAGDPVAIDPASEEILLEVGQPRFNHNGGNIAFGPDGYLYWPLGDGGNNTEGANGQDLTTLLGAILRLDVDHPSGGLPYGIPPDNPFAATDGPERDEIYAWGFRSPWRSSFDAATGDYWVGDVGQNRYEEVDLVELGGNYGWDIMEAAHCYNPPSNCTTEGLRMPVWEYDRSGGSSVTGGYVYRGGAIPDLVGAYIYGDFTSGRIWALEVDEQTGVATNTELKDTDLFISSFGEDAQGELYVLNYFGGVYRLVSKPVATEPGGLAAAASLRLVGPNPFRTRTTLALRAEAPGRARVAVYDVLGREVAVLHDGAVGAEEVRVSFDAAMLPAGTYTVRMTEGGVTHAVRMTRVR